MRVTTQLLEARVAWLNQLAGTPEQPWAKGVAQVGCYHLSYAYGGVALHQICSQGGGVNDVLRCGYQTKSKLFDLLDAFILGMRAAKK